MIRIYRQYIYTAAFMVHIIHIYVPVLLQVHYESSEYGFRLNLVTRGIPPDFHGDVHLFIQPYAIGLFFPPVQQTTSGIGHRVKYL